MKFKLNCFAGFSALTVSLASMPILADSVSFTELPNALQTGLNYSIRVSDEGTAAYVSKDGNFYSWSSSAGLTDLGDIPDPYGTLPTYRSNISTDGSVIAFHVADQTLSGGLNTGTTVVYSNGSEQVLSSFDRSALSPDGTLLAGAGAIYELSSGDFIRGVGSSDFTHRVDLNTHFSNDAKTATFDNV